MRRASIASCDVVGRPFHCQTMNFDFDFDLITGRKYTVIGTCGSESDCSTTAASPPRPCKSHLKLP